MGINQGIGIEGFKKELEDELYRLLNFWKDEAIDLKHGGFIGRIDHYGIKDWSAPKGAVQVARILWTFSAAYRLTQKKQFLNCAERAYAYLIQHYWDKACGGLIWAVSNQGRPLSKRKQGYAQGFGIYALSEYYRVSDKKESLDYAIQLYNILENKFQDKQNGGYIESLNQDWTPLDDMRLSDKDANLPKSMNTHLHILEPYSNLFRVWQNEELKNSIIKLIHVFKDRIIDSHSGHFNLFFEMDWSVKSNIVSYGHDIEGAWLLHEAALLTEDEKLINLVQQDALRLVDITLNEGLAKDGSLFYEKEGDHLDTDRHWWPQAEAMVGLFDAWEISGKSSYLERLDAIWTFINEHLLDVEKGEWYWSVDSHGKANEEGDKVGFWKCPYHNSRAIMELLERLEKLEKSTKADIASDNASI